MAQDAIELAISGMTCTSCAARIEKKLNKLPGVHATVNYATESAHIDVDGDVDLAQLINTVEQTGYAASPVESAEGGDAEVVALRRRFWISLVLALPVVATAMVPPLQFPGWQWMSLALATAVVGWGA